MEYLARVRGEEVGWQRELDRLNRSEEGLHLNQARNSAAPEPSQPSSDIASEDQNEASFDTQIKRDPEQEKHPAFKIEDEAIKFDNASEQTTGAPTKSEDEQGPRPDQSS